MNLINRILLTLCFLGIVTVTQTMAQVKVSSLGINVGYYTPEMDYWNDNALSGWDNQFSGSISGNVLLEVYLSDPVSARIDAGYYKEDITQSGIPYGNTTRTDKIEIQMIPVTFSLIGRIHPANIEPLEFYGGAGIGVNFITMKYTRDLPDGQIVDEPDGRNYLAYFTAGLDYPVMANLGLGLEFRYIWGTYKQLLGDAGLSENVSINGPQGLFSIKYLF
jgi:opacity protein-like surface antigen